MQSQHLMYRYKKLFILIALVCLPKAVLACSSCGCTLSSDWGSQGYSTQSGLRFDLRYDYLDQSQLRSGTGADSRSDYPLPASREIENQTINRYLTLGVDYSPNQTWGVNVQVPYVNRDHSSWAAGDTQLTYSDTEAFGDVKILARYQGFSEQHDLGLQFGLKLPTGEFHDRFVSGPEQGELLDRGLQAGTGTTDFLIGAYQFGSLNRDWDYFTQALIQKPIDKREGYYQDTSLNVNAGLRYMSNPVWEPQLQLNAKISGRDHGVQADGENSGGTILYFSPGLTVNTSKQLSVYGFVQAPLYQRVNGLQLAPRYTASVGLRYAF